MKAEKGEQEISRRSFLGYMAGAAATQAPARPSKTQGISAYRAHSVYNPYYHDDKDTRE